MTPKEKAEELFIKCYPTWYDNGSVAKKKYAKEYALIAVDEILAAIQLPPIENKGHALYDSQVDYWKQVRKEIENL